MKASKQDGGITPLILKLESKWRSVVKLSPWLPCAVAILGVVLITHRKWYNYTSDFTLCLCGISSLEPARSRVLPEKLTGPELVKKFPAFYGTL